MANHINAMMVEAQRMAMEMEQHESEAIKKKKTHNTGQSYISKEKVLTFHTLSDSRGHR